MTYHQRQSKERVKTSVIHVFHSHFRACQRRRSSGEASLDKCCRTMIHQPKCWFYKRLGI